MIDSFSITLEGPTGIYVADLSDYLEFDCARNISAVGTLTLRIPDRSYALAMWRRDMRIKLRRTFPGGGSYLVGRTPWFLRSAEYDEDQKQWVLSAVDKLALLDRRIVAYPPETIYADKTIEEGNQGPIDDLMRAYVRENLGPAALDPARHIDDIAIEADAGEAPDGEKEAGWRGLLETLRELADDSTAQGYPLFFDLLYSETASQPYLFVIKTGYLGRDRSAAGGVRFSKLRGNLAEALLKVDYSTEKTFAYIGGDGQGIDRLMWSLGYQNVIEQSPYGRSEIFVDARDAIETTVMEAAARTELAKLGGKVAVTARLLETERQRFGRDFDFGDLVPLSIRDYEFNAHIDAFRLSSTRGQPTNLEIRVTAERSFASFVPLVNDPRPVGGESQGLVALVSDGFSLLFGTTDGAGHTGTGGGGLLWTTHTGSYSNTGGRAVSGALALASIDAGVTDVRLSVEVVAISTAAAVWVRSTDVSNYVSVRTDGVNITVEKVIAGSGTVVFTAKITYQAGAEMTVFCRGTTFDVYYNQQAIGTVSITDAALQTGTRCAMIAEGPAGEFDNFVVLPY